MTCQCFLYSQLSSPLSHTAICNIFLEASSVSRICPCPNHLNVFSLRNSAITINYELLLRRLEHSVGISGAALEWLHSYVSERYHQVAVSSARSSHCHLERGVAEGSVLGPLLYCIYTRPIGDIVTRHGLQYHCYADDTQIYVTIEKDVSIESALARIETCIIVGQITETIFQIVIQAPTFA